MGNRIMAIHGDNNYLWHLFSPKETSVTEIFPKVIELLKKTTDTHWLFGDSRFCEPKNYELAKKTNLYLTTSCKSTRSKTDLWSTLVTGLKPPLSNFCQKNELISVVYCQQKTSKIGNVKLMTNAYSVQKELKSSFNNRRQILNLYDQSKRFVFFFN